MELVPCGGPKCKRLVRDTVQGPDLCSRHIPLPEPAPYDPDKRNEVEDPSIWKAAAE